jgi:hypothetical protein
MPVMNPTGHAMTVGETGLRDFNSVLSQPTLAPKSTRGKSSQQLHSAAGLIPQLRLSSSDTAHQTELHFIMIQYFKN